MTARKVVTRSGRGVRGYSPSVKMGSSIPWESTLERDAILIFELSTNVENYYAQPEKIFFELDGVMRAYYPDFKLELVDGTLLYIEVKPKGKLSEPHIKQRMQAIKAYYEKSGASFLTIDEYEIRSEPRLTNLKLLSYHVSNGEQDRLSSCLESLRLIPPQTIAGAASLLGDIRFVYQLIALGHLGCDIQQPLTNNTSIWFPKEGEHHDAFFI